MRDGFLAGVRRWGEYSGEYRRVASGWQREGRIPVCWRLLLGIGVSAYDLGMSQRTECAAWRLVGAACCALAPLIVSCSGAERRADFGSIDPSERTAAAARAAEARDTSAVPHLVRMLDSSDGAMRMVAIGALERITGERLGYEATAPEPERRQAVERWVEYSIERGYAMDQRVGDRTALGEGVR